MTDLGGFDGLQHDLGAIASDWRAARAERQARRHLERATSTCCATRGLLLAPVPVEMGGLWQGVPRVDPPAVRVAADPRRRRRLGHTGLGDAPGGVGYWLATPDSDQHSWAAQRHAVLADRRRPVTSGARSHRSPAAVGTSSGRGRPPPRSTAPTPISRAAASLTGDKHFGSGLGICDFMFTTGVVEGEDGPAAFAMDMRPWLDDTSSNLVVTAEWDGAGDGRHAEPRAPSFDAIAIRRVEEYAT